MPLPSISDAMRKASEPIKMGWSLVELSAIRTLAAKAKDGKPPSTNIFFDFTIVQGPLNSGDNEGKKVSLMISAAGLDAGVQETCSTYTALIASLVNDPAVSGAPDENALIGKRCWAELSQRVFDGKTFTDMKVFSPESVLPF